MNTKINLNALRYYIAVVESGSYSQAARRLRLTQPAVSRQIQYLERTYKTRLLRREGRRFEVTEAGEQLMIEAKEILNRFDALEHVVSTAAKEPSGTLSIGITWSIGESFLPLVLMHYRTKYPKVFLRVIQDSNDRLADALVTHRIDIAVLYHRPRESELEFSPLLDAEVGLIAPYGTQSFTLDATPLPESMTLSQALQYPLILPHKGWGMRDLIESHCDGQNVGLNIVMESDSLPLAKSLVLAGHGYTLVTRGSVNEEVRRSELRFIALHSPSIAWHMYAATRKHYSKTLAQETMMEELRNYIQEFEAESPYSVV